MRMDINERISAEPCLVLGVPKRRVASDGG